MNRNRLAVLTILFAGVIGVLAMASVTRNAWLADGAWRSEKQRADQQEAIRLALWRLDVAATEVLSQESARAPQFYQLLEAEEPAGKGPAEPPAATTPITAIAVQRPENASNWCRRFFAIPVNAGGLAVEAAAFPEDLRHDFRQLVAISPKLPTSLAVEELDREGELLASEQSQTGRSRNEFSARNRTFQQQIVGYANVNALMPVASPLQMTPMQPHWFGDERLILLRRVGDAASDAQQLHVVEMDWPRMRSDLLAGVTDLLPTAQLQPLDRTEDVAEEGTRMAALPLRLLAGPPSTLSLKTEPSSLFPLVIAWIAVVAALTLAGVLVARIIGLSRRRAEFATAVTHELRTPLTTMKMYTEMLVAGMVPQDQQTDYLNTIRDQSERLSRLVENVLAYSRLERGRSAGEPRTHVLSELLERMLPRLRAQAANHELQLIAPEMDSFAFSTVMGDALVVEQILMNLVDNAGKYAKPSESACVDLTVSCSGKDVLIGLRDYGPGLPSSERGSLFIPFSKSAQQAAKTAPGIGLGLALSRRLAKTQAGRLDYFDARPGCHFQLRLVAAGRPIRRPRA